MQTGHCDYISDYMFQVKCIQLDGNELKYQTTIADWLTNWLSRSCLAFRMDCADFSRLERNFSSLEKKKKTVVTVVTPILVAFNWQNVVIHIIKGLLRCDPLGL